MRRLLTEKNIVIVLFVMVFIVFSLAEKETKKIRYEKRNTKRVKDDMIFWFAISIQRANRLEAAPKAQEIELVCYNKKDYTRRSQIIMNSRGGSTFNVVEVKDDSSEPYFVNFEFFVSQRQSKDYEPPEENFTTVSAPVTKVIDNREAVLTRASFIKLKSFNGSLWIRVRKIKGSHEEHAAVMVNF